MARTTGSNGARTHAAIRAAATGLIYRQGFAAMNLRDLAAEVGIQPGSLYNHIDSKQALLFDLMQDHMAALLAGTDAALDAAGPALMDRLRAFLDHHVLYHMERREEIAIANSELRALEPENRARIVALRSAYEARLTALLREGVAAGLLSVPDVAVTAYAMLAMLTGICSWYRPDGRLGKEELVALHTALALNGILRRQHQA
ncbi:TetR/AcrR family transcriptional regulator [Paracraurococcus ruber]|uniref:TetR family transcriptional regulator n=1 Tax=Paracraurococcus ruber TaxID=77675 RepID=A0ABS1CWF4_9PROT|nr:TetR/AcrR family transcriptional regulator [Paracraurococcus ruber]MBK1658636.1 TetR family transcriptional regulator [Paracraurococcus ruber]TDG32651.1 TetR/AcrR family transcriptional regulator [Paracraurococcus ruber]